MPVGAQYIVHRQTLADQIANETDQSPEEVQRATEAYIQGAESEGFEMPDELKSALIHNVKDTWIG